MDDLFSGPDTRTPEQKVRDERRTLAYMIPHNPDVDIEDRVNAMKRLAKFIDTGE